MTSYKIGDIVRYKFDLPPTEGIGIIIDKEYYDDEYSYLYIHCISCDMHEQLRHSHNRYEAIYRHEIVEKINE